MANEFIARKGLIALDDSTVSGSLTINTSGSTVLDIQGSQGQLFSVTDSLTGTLMSVNDISGLPILEVSSDDKVVMGTFGAEGLVVTGSNVNIGKVVSNSHTVTGSLGISGSFNVNGITTVSDLSVTNLTASGNVKLGDATSDSHTVTGSLGISGSVSLNATLELNNFNITGVNLLQFSDTGPGEGIEWKGGNFKIYESPNDLTTNSPGNLQFVSGSTRVVTIGTDRTVNVANGELNITSSAANPTILLYDSTAGNDPYIRIVPATTTNAFAIGVDDSDSDKFKISYGTNAALGTNDRLTIDTSGNVGIGTTSPAARLHVSSGTNGDAVLLLEADTDNSNEDDNPYIRFVQDSGLVESQIGQVGNPGTFFQNSQANAFFINTVSGSTPIQFATSNTASVIIDTSGRVGIGTTTPSASLQIDYGTATSVPGITYAGMRLNRSSAVNNDFVAGTVMTAFENKGGFVGAGGNGIILQTYNGATATTRMFISASGNVGIGTTAPQRTLDVNGEIQNNGIFRRSGNVFIKSTGSETLIGPGGSGIVTFHNNSTMTTSDETVRIDSSGNVGIGTTTPAQKLDIIGNTQISGQFAQGVSVANKVVGYGAEFRSSGASAQIVFGRDGSSVGSGAIGADSNHAFAVFTTSSFAKMLVVEQEGDVGIGTTNPSYKLDVNGIFRATGLWTTLSGTTQWGASSTPTAYGTLTWDTGYARVYATSGNRLDLGGGGNSAHLTISTTGNVGVGTTTPNAKLDVNGDAIVTGSLTVTGTIIAQEFKAELVSSSIIYESGSTKFGDSLDDVHQRTGSMFISGNVNLTGVITNPAGTVRMESAAGQELEIASTRDIRLLIDSNDDDTVNRFEIQSNTNTSNDSNIVFVVEQTGRVGINTTSPSYMLDINDDNTIGVGLRVTGGGNGSDFVTFVRDTGGTGTISFSAESSRPQVKFIGSGNTFAVGESGSSFVIADDTSLTNGGTNGTQRLLIDSTGNVGIGTTSPSTKLEVAGGSAGTETSILQIRSNDTSNNTATTLRFANSTNPTAAQGTAEITAVRTNAGTAGATDLVFRNSEGATVLERMRINSSGNVGIGANPSYKLDLAGTLRFNGIEGTTAIRIDGGGSTDTSIFRIDANNNGDSNASDYGFTLKYMGSRSGNDNSLSIFTDNQTAGSQIEALTLVQNGNLGLGTINPSVKLEVSGSVGAPGYSSGFAGSSWRLDYSPTSSSLEVDNLTVRGTMKVYELLINQIRATNGTLFISSVGKVDTVQQSGSSTTYFLTFDTGSGNTLGHGFLVGDIIRAQRTNPSSSQFVYRSDMTVEGVSGNGRIVTASLTGSNPPSSSYEYVRLGNRSNTARQGTVYLTADDTNAPFIDVLDGIVSHTDWNSASGSAKLKTRMGKLNGITSTRFGSLSGYGFYASGSAYLEGGINASTGNIGGFAITQHALTGSGFFISGGAAANDFFISSSGFNVKGNGNITASAGLIGDWKIAGGAIYQDFSGNLVILGNPDNVPGAWTSTWRGIQAGTNANNRIWLAADEAGTNYEMTVYSGGNYIVRLGNTANTIAGWNIDSSAIYTGTKDTSGYSTTGITLNSGGSIHTPNFYVDTSGNAFFKGTLSAPVGNIGGFHITQDALTGSGFFISGGAASNGFFISSSGFNVKGNGNITASAGLVGGFNITSTEINSGTTLILRGNNGQITGSSVLFTGGRIGGFNLSTNQIASNTGTLILKDNGQITGSSVLFTGGTVGGFTLSTNQIASNTGTLILKDNGQITGSSVLFTGGRIGGFTVTADVLSGAGFLLSGSATGNGFFISSSGFNVKASGNITASAGLVGGWSLGTNNLSSGNVSLIATSVSGGLAVNTGGDRVITVGDFPDVTITRSPGLFNTSSLFRSITNGTVTIVSSSNSFTVTRNTSTGTNPVVATITQSLSNIPAGRIVNLSYDYSNLTPLTASMGRITYDSEIKNTNVAKSGGATTTITSSFTVTSGDFAGGIGTFKAIMNVNAFSGSEFSTANIISQKVTSSGVTYFESTGEYNDVEIKNFPWSTGTKFYFETVLLNFGDWDNATQTVRVSGSSFVEDTIYRPSEITASIVHNSGEILLNAYRDISTDTYSRSFTQDFVTTSTLTNPRLQFIIKQQGSGSAYTNLPSFKVENINVAADIPRVNISRNQGIFYKSPSQFLQWTTSSLEIKGDIEASSLTVRGPATFLGDVTIAGDVTAHPPVNGAGSTGNSAGTVVQNLTFDTFGHTTGVSSINLDNRYQLLGSYVTVGTNQSITGVKTFQPSSNPTIVLGSGPSAFSGSIQFLGTTIAGTLASTVIRQRINAPSSIVIDLPDAGGTMAMLEDITATNFTGTLPVNKGGTGATSFTNNRVLTGNGTSAIVDEANLTFDGTHLSIRTTDTGAVLTLKQDADTDAGGIRLIRSGTSNYWAIYTDADGLQFKFNGGSNGGYLDDGVNVANIDFTGQHRSLLGTNNNTSLLNTNELVGLIVIADGTYINLDGTTEPKINEAIPNVLLSEISYDKRVFGVISDKEDLSDGERKYATGAWVSTFEISGSSDERLIINSLGEGGMWVCNYSGSFENGDYITTSPIKGLGMRQNDDILHNYTVGKITQDCEFNISGSYIEFEFSGSMYRKQFVGVTYHCG